MERFSIDNIFGNVSLDQFKKTAESLESSLRNVRPEITSELLLTTNGQDYRGYGSLTIEIPEVEEALSGRERYALSDLDKGLWKSFESGLYEAGLYIKDPSVNDSYMVCLNAEAREPNKLFFYAQGLDEKSQEIFHSYKQPGLLQKIGDGFAKRSDFAVVYMLSNLRSR